MNATFWSCLAALVTATMIGCEQPDRTIPADASQQRIDVNTDHPGRNVNVTVSPEGVDIGVNRDRVSKEPGVGVDVEPGRVDVRVQGDGEVLERAQQRRKERQREKAAE